MDNNDDMVSTQAKLVVVRWRGCVLIKDNTGPCGTCITGQGCDASDNHKCQPICLNKDG